MLERGKISLKVVPQVHSSDQIVSNLGSGFEAFESFQEQESEWKLEPEFHILSLALSDEPSYLSNSSPICLNSSYRIKAYPTWQLIGFEKPFSRCCENFMECQKSFNESIWIYSCMLENSNTKISHRTLDLFTFTSLYSEVTLFSACVLASWRIVNQTFDRYAIFSFLWKLCSYNRNGKGKVREY